MADSSRNASSAHIPWGSISGEVLEELVFQLMDAMGAKEVTWRSGGIGVTNADGGRDIEATFFIPSPDGEPRRERWWVECKGRSTTVPKSAVTDAANNASAHAPNVDRLVVVSNSSYTNPTVDWVNTWNSSPSHLPKVLLWGREKLELLMRRHPVTAARVVPESIEPSKRVELLDAYFKESGIAPLASDLRYFWDHFSEHPKALMTKWLPMFTYGEVVHGDINVRPWGTLISNKSAPDVLLNTLITLPLILATTRSLEVSKVTSTMSYLLQCSICNLPPRVSSLIINDPFAYAKGETSDFPDEWREAITLPAMTLLVKELGDACASDCMRVIADLRALPEDPSGPYFWKRFGVGNPDGKLSDSVLIAEDYTAPCAVGLSLDTDQHCPLFESVEEVTPELIANLRHIIMARFEQPDGRASDTINDPTETIIDAAISSSKETRERDFRFQMRDNSSPHLDDFLNTGRALQLIKSRQRELKGIFRNHAIATTEEDA